MPVLTATQPILGPLMDAVTALEGTVFPDAQQHDVYRWRPDMIDPPAIWNVLLAGATAPHTTADLQRTITIGARLGDRITDTGQFQSDIEGYVDAMWAVLDQAFWDRSADNPILALATWADEPAVSTFSDEFGAVRVAGFEFQLRFQLYRRVT